jgi:hypothetical protein
MGLEFAQLRTVQGEQRGLGATFRRIPRHREYLDPFRPIG